MLHTNFKTLKRSISDKLLGKGVPKSETVVPADVCDRSSTSSGSQDDSLDEDPYREILRTYNDNVSHLVFHGSSLHSMSMSLDLSKAAKTSS